MMEMSWAFWGPSCESMCLLYVVMSARLRRERLNSCNRSDSLEHLPAAVH